METTQEQSEIVVSRNHRGGFALAIISALMLLTIIPFLAILTWTISAFTSLFPAIFLFPTVIILLLGYVVLLFGYIWGPGRAVWNVATRGLSVQEPLLVINRRGIQVGKQPFDIGDIFLAWNEIETLSFCRFGLGQEALGIRLRNPRKFAPYFGIWKGILLRTPFRPLHASLMKVDQRWMKLSINELLEQIRWQYAYELRVYHVQLQI